MAEDSSGEILTALTSRSTLIPAGWFSSRMSPTTLMLALLAIAVVVVPASAPEASAHPVCVGDTCNCPPENSGTHIHVNTYEPNVCFQLQ